MNTSADKQRYEHMTRQWNHNFTYEKGKTTTQKIAKFKQTYSFSFTLHSTVTIVSTWSLNFISFMLNKAYLLRSRGLYFLNSWVYTTNHKRIAVNYFWFVILAGIAGMSLATVIRLEMAYPGVGILAGDSLQYLSIVTAHAVIMVFFMLMPLLFGAFGNFLLPTQLGVHDVAFPRLNSAAFWFLPAGLIMLCQLLCLDRRYQRMNCFNVRELQALLKNRFFMELINSKDQHDFLNQTAIGLRFKTNNLDSIHPNSLLAFRYGVNTTPQSRIQGYQSVLNDPFFNREFLVSGSPLHSSLSLFKNFTAHSLFSSVYSLVFWMERGLASGASLAYSNFYNANLVVSSLGGALSFAKTLGDRMLGTITHLFSLNEPFWLTFDAYSYLYSVIWSRGLANTLVNAEGASQYRVWLNSPVLSFFEGSESFTKLLDFSLSRSLGVLSFAWLNALPTARLAVYGSLPFEFRNASQFGYPLFSDLVSLGFNWWLSFTALLENAAHLCAFSVTNPRVFIGEVLLSFQNLTFSFLSLSSVFGFTPRARQWSFPLWTNSSVESSNEELVYSSSLKTLESLSFTTLFGSKESSSNYRLQRHQMPIFKSDFKAGNFFPKNDLIRRPALFMTAAEITKGTRKPLWYLSDYYNEAFNDLRSLYFTAYGLDNQACTDPLYKFDLAKPHSPYSYFQVFTLFRTSSFWTSVSEEVTEGSKAGSSKTLWVLNDSFKGEQAFINQRWIALNALDQKFYRMFNTMSLQQRVLSNWRQLKFTREGWRCRLLAARHQKTLFNRYVNEEGLVWAIERNAKDVLPGWAMITPFSARTRFTAIGKVDIGLMGVFLVLNSSIVSSANFLVTYRYLSTLNNRKMRDARSFFTEGLMVASWMMIAANPMLAIGIIMLLSDRHWQTSFFDYSGGGDTVLFQHMFWFFGHPEVYVIMLPVFGFTNTILSYYLRKRVSARASLLYSMYTIAFLGFFVWGHHMYMVGLAHTTRMLFSTLTVMISVPAATKLMHWCVTLVNSSFCMELPFFFTLLFIFFFVSGGISGMAVAHTGMDILFHDSFYVIGHFHVMFAGSAMFGSFGAFYFYFPAIFGCKYSRIWGYLHATYYLLGQLLTVIPMFWLGYSGMPRRVLDYPAALGGWHAITSAGHLLSVAGMLAFFFMIFDSHRQFRPASLSTQGVSRFSLRLSFYLYEIARIRKMSYKWGWSLSSFTFTDSVQLAHLNFFNKETLESTLYSYAFVQNDLKQEYNDECQSFVAYKRDAYYDSHYRTSEKESFQVLRENEPRI